MSSKLQWFLGLGLLLAVTAVLKLWPRGLQAWWRSLAPLSLAGLFPHLALVP